MPDAMLRAFGWGPLLIHGDPCVLDRWLWLRRELSAGSKRTLDAGCGNGAFSIYARRLGNEVVAASSSAREQEDARRRAEVVGAGGIEFHTLDLGDLDAHRDELGRFDQIICMETIEHLHDDERLVRTLAEMLEPGGRLLLTAPFDGHRAMYREHAHPSPQDGWHVRFGYSQARLRELATGAGLDVEREAFVSGIVSQKLTSLLRRLTVLLGRPIAWVLILPLRVLVVLDRSLTRMLRYPYLSVALRAVRRG